MLKLICPNKKIFNKKILLNYKNYFKCSFLDIDQSKFKKIVHNYDIVLLRFNYFLDYKKNTRIKYILSPTTGLTHISEKFRKNSKFKIFNLKDNIFLKNIRASSEFTLFLILATIRKFKDVNQPNQIGNEIHDKTIGIIGLGRIGVSVAKFCTLLGAKVIYFDKNKKNISSHFKKVNLNYLLKNSDLLTICIPSQNKNFNFLSKSKIKLLKKGSIIINTSRGEIIDEKYIISLAKKKFLYYSADVIQNEQFVKNKNYILLNKMSNIFITKHIAGLTEESIYKTDKKIYNDFIKFYEKN